MTSATGLIYLDEGGVSKWVDPSLLKLTGMYEFLQLVNMLPACTKVYHREPQSHFVRFLLTRVFLCSFPVCTAKLPFSAHCWSKTHPPLSSARGPAAESVWHHLLPDQPMGPGPTQVHSGLQAPHERWSDDRSQCTATGSSVCVNSGVCSCM